MNFTEFLRAEKKEASLCSQKRSPLHKIGEGHWTMTHSAAARYRGGWGKHRAMPVKCWYRFIGWYGTKTIRAYQLSEKGNNHWTMEKNQATSYHIHGGAGLHGCPTGRAPSAELAILGHIPKSMIKSSHCPTFLVDSIQTKSTILRNQFNYATSSDCSWRRAEPTGQHRALPAVPRRWWCAWALNSLYPQRLDGPTEPGTTEGRSD